MGYLPRGQRPVLVHHLHPAHHERRRLHRSRWREATEVVLLLAQTGELFYAGFYWQPFTAMFVHFDILHILFNMFALVYFGTVVEGSYSRSQYLTVYFGAGLARQRLRPSSSSLRTTRPAGHRGRYSGWWERTWPWRGRAPGWSIAALYAGADLRRQRGTRV